MNEQQLIRRIQQKGDADSYERIYRTYVDRIYPLALRICGDQHRAEELTQDIFVRTWQKIGLYKGKSSFYTWLYRLAMNVILGSERSLKIRKEREILSSDLSQIPMDCNDLDTRIDLQRAMERLPIKARAVLVLHDIEGLKHAQIANCTGISVGTSKAQLHRARKLMREMLNR